MRWLIVLLYTCCAGLGLAQHNGCNKAARFEKKAFEEMAVRSSRTLGNYDLKYHRLAFWVDPAVANIRGKITSYFVPSSDLDEITFDLSGALSLDSAWYHGVLVPGTQLPGDVISIDLPSTITTGTLDSVTVFYHGTPPTSGFGSFATALHDSVPVMWTLSQPYGARDWWACKEDLNDKIDSVDIIITHPAIYRASSNGLLLSETIMGTDKVTHWKHRSLIPTYLIGIAVSNYAVYTHNVPFGVTNVPIVNYVYPEDSAAAYAATLPNVEQMQLFDTLFGLYPFHTEKYGHTQIGWGGGIEHQTNSFVGHFHYELLAHELAHQWFGDYITCGSWHDIWLNEGFATYLSGLCYEHLGPEPIYWKPFLRAQIELVTDLPDGSVFCPDTTNVNRIFDSRLTYRKGCMILHTLRWVMGDSAFYDGMHSYLGDPALAFGFSRLEQFKAHMETAHGNDLTWYFDDWYYGEGFPSYNFDWETDENNVVTVEIEQTQSHPSVDFYELPLPLYFKNATQDTMIVVNHTMSGEVFSIPLNFTPDSLVFDPDYWIISAANTISGEPVPEEEHILDVYPTLASNTLYVSLAQLSPNETVRIMTAEGKTILHEDLTALRTTLDISSLAKGIYVVAVTSDTEKIVKKFVKQ